MPIENAKQGGHDSADYRDPQPQGGPPASDDAPTPGKPTAATFGTHEGYPGTGQGAH